MLACGAQDPDLLITQAIACRLPGVGLGRHWFDHPDTVAGVQSRPELNGTQVTTKKFLKDKGRYTVQLPPLFADGKPELINLKPANLVLAQGSTVIVTGLTGAPELLS